MARTQVAIIGAGPAGLLLSQLLSLHGIDNVVLERQSAAHVVGRIRAGVLEQDTVELLVTAKVGDRLLKERLLHRGVSLAFDGRCFRADLYALSGRAISIYGQSEVTKDLIAAHAAAAGKLIFEAADVTIEGFWGTAPIVRYVHKGRSHELRCDFIIGCDGFHGICRRSIPASAIQTYERLYPFGWLGVLADVPPVAEELIYSSHERGFALCSMRSPARSRYYVQCSLQDSIAQWSDERFWAELRSRLPPSIAAAIVAGPSIEKSIAPLRSFVVEPLRFGRLFLAGDAAHIVPPTGAKGLNLAAGDVRVLYHALTEFYRTADERELDLYSAHCLRRIWKAVRFSWWFTNLTHRFSDDPFDYRLQLAELDYLSGSPAALSGFAENYVGLPVEASN